MTDQGYTAFGDGSTGSHNEAGPLAQRGMKRFLDGSVRSGSESKSMDPDPAAKAASAGISAFFDDLATQGPAKRYRPSPAEAADFKRGMTVFDNLGFRDTPAALPGIPLMDLFKQLGPYIAVDDHGESTNIANVRIADKVTLNPGFYGADYKSLVTMSARLPKDVMLYLRKNLNKNADMTFDIRNVTSTVISIAELAFTMFRYAAVAPYNNAMATAAMKEWVMFGPLFELTQEQGPRGMIQWILQAGIKGVFPMVQLFLGIPGRPMRNGAHCWMLWCRRTQGKEDEEMRAQRETGIAKPFVRRRPGVPELAPAEVFGDPRYAPVQYWRPEPWIEYGSGTPDWSLFTQWDWVGRADYYGQITDSTPTVVKPERFCNMIKSVLYRKGVDTNELREQFDALERGLPKMEVLRRPF